MVILDLLVVSGTMKELLRYALIISGASYLIQSGHCQLLKLSVNNWDIKLKVNHCYHHHHHYYYCCYYYYYYYYYYLLFTGTLAVRGSQYGKPNNLTIHFRNVSCNGDEATFSDCSYSTLSLAQGKALLATDDVAGVKCYTPDQCVPPPPATGNECTNGALRQRGGQGGIPEGNLEYCYRGYWSPFCYLGTTEATVACRQLGYSSYDCKK